MHPGMQFLEGILFWPLRNTPEKEFYLSGHLQPLEVNYCFCSWRWKWLKKNFDCAIMAAPRDTFFGIYAHMTARNKRSPEVNWGHLEVTRSHMLTTTHRYPFFCMYTQISTLSYIGYVNLTIKIIRSHFRTHNVKN